jgi:hypothetical protein
VTEAATQQAWKKASEMRQFRVDTTLGAGYKYKNRDIHFVALHEKRKL